MDTDVYLHKTVTFRAGRHTLLFRTSQELFSSHDIDTGTRFLLRSIIEGGYAPESILDIGCGYGAIGITLKKIYPASAVHLVDRDALAVEYTRQNAGLNGLEGVTICGSLGYDDVAGNNFDLITANIPGKAGEAVIAYLLREARYFLTPGGTVVVVIVAALAAMVAQLLADTPGCEIILRQDRSGHAVFHYRFTGSFIPPASTAFERGVYHRQRPDISIAGVEYKMQTAHGLPEFDSLGYGSEMLAEALVKLRGKVKKQAAVFNPGQGHLPVILWKLAQPLNIALVDRDLLALRYSRFNLVRNGCPDEKIQVSHRVGAVLQSSGDVDLFIGVLRVENKEANLQTVRQAAGQLSNGGRLIVSGGSTAITRIQDYAASAPGLRIVKRERRRGFSLLALERKSVP